MAMRMIGAFPRATHIDHQTDGRTASSHTRSYDATRPHLGGRDIGLTDRGNIHKLTGSWEIAAARRRRRSVEGKQGRSLPASTGRKDS